MNTLKKARLQRNGWAVGDTAEFLKLNTQEAQFVELKLALAAGVRQLREQSGITQAALAEQLGDLKANGPGALAAYVRNVRLKLFDQAKTVILEVGHE